MKKIIHSVFVLAALTATTLFTSCGDKTTDPGTTESAAPTLVVNDGVTQSYGSLLLDSVFIKVVASADADRKITKLVITRAVTGGSTTTIKSATYSAKDVIYNHLDLLKENSVTVDEEDIITYAVEVTDDKGKTATKAFKVTIKSMVTSPQILLGGPSNTANENRFFGIADGFRMYRAGTTGANLAKDNSSKIDFLFFYNSAGSVGNALYSPDYAFASGSGWYTETSSWPTKNKTQFKLAPDITASAFDALNGSTFMTEIGLVDWSSGAVDRVANLSVNQVLAFKKSDGKRGFILVGNPAASATGQILLVCKAEL